MQKTTGAVQGTIVIGAQQSVPNWANEHFNFVHGHFSEVLL